MSPLRIVDSHPTGTRRDAVNRGDSPTTRVESRMSFSSTVAQPAVLRRVFRVGAAAVALAIVVVLVLV